MLRIRLRRIGKKRQPYYRMVVAEQLAPRDGAFLETLGSYDPHQDPPYIKLNEERAKTWLSHGAQPSQAAEKILRRAGLISTPGRGGPQKPAAAAATPEASAASSEAPAEPAEAAADPGEAEASES